MRGTASGNLPYLRCTPDETHRPMQLHRVAFDKQLTGHTSLRSGCVACYLPLYSSVAALLPAPNEDGDDLPSARRHC